MPKLSWGGKGRTCWSLFICFCLCLCLAEQAVGQATGGSISGRVLDASGAAIPAATVTIKNTETGTFGAVNTDEAGNYRVLSLSVGRYEVSAEKPGFKTIVRSGISLSVGQEAVVNLEMQVGEVTQQVTVTEESPVINTTTAQISGLVSEQQVKDLPLNGRSFDALITLNPGTINYTAFTGGGGNSFTVAGRRAGENLYLLNGIEYTSSNNLSTTPQGASGQLLGIDAIREFNVLTDSYGAEYGKRAGGQINVITQSGTNRLHGSLFEFVRNNAFDARPYFATSDIPFRRNQFGGSVGGPIKQDKTFFFLSYEGERQRLALVGNVFVPDANARKGILPCISGGTPACGANPVGTPTAVPSLDPRMLPYMALWPVANGPNVGGGIATLSASPTQSIREDFSTSRLDHKISEKDTASIAYTFDDGVNFTPTTDPLFGNTTRNRAQVFSIQETHTFSPEVLNTARVGFSRSHSSAIAVTLPSVPANLGMVQGQQPGQIVIGGGGGGASASGAASSIVNSGSGQRGVNENVKNLYTFQDDVMIIRGKHQFSFGGWAQRVQTNANTRDYQLAQATFDSLLLFLQGTGKSFTGAPSATFMYWRQWEGAWYAQDSVQLRPNLTVRIGLRHEFTNGWNEDLGRAAQFIPDANGVLQTTPRIADSVYTQNNSKKLFSPRVGLAWDPFGKGKTSIRSAFGMYYSLIDELSFQLGVVPPFNPSVSYTNYKFADLVPIPSTVGPSCQGGLPAGCIRPAPRGIQPDAKTPTVAEWNLSIEQAVSQNMSFRIGYVGSHTYHNLVNVDNNSIVPQICSNAAGCTAGGILAAASRSNVPQGTLYVPVGTRPNPDLGNSFFWYTMGVGNYNALQLDLTKRLASGFSFRGSYTFSKNLDEGTGLNGNNSKNQTQEVMIPSNPRRDYGRSGLDFEHQLSGNATYQLPFGRGKRFLSSDGGLADKLVGGWQVNGIVTHLSGFPITPVLGTNQSGNGDARNPDRPSLNPSFTGNPYPHTVAQWFDPQMFSLPAGGTWGNAGRGSLQGPGMTEVDFSVFKSTPIRESERLEFRAEFFNIANIVNLGIPNFSMFSSGKISPTAGRISSTTTDPREIQFGLRFIF